MDEQLRWLEGLAQADLVRARKASPAELEAVPGGRAAGSHAHDAALPRPARRLRGPVPFGTLIGAGEDALRGEKAAGRFFIFDAGCLISRGAPL